MELTPEEQREYERQQKELKHPAYHEEIKCGSKLLARVVVKKHAHLHRLYCPTHHLYVDPSGWEIGWVGGSYSRDLNKN